MKREIIALAAAVLITGFFIGYFYAISEVKYRIAELEEENNKLKLELEKATINYEVYFSPKGGAADRVIYWIDRANKSIHIAIFSFTDDEIGDSLVRARRRNLDVKVIFEEDQISKYSEYWKIKEAGAEVANDTNSAYMHNKFAIIDGYLVLTGSFNWSESADERNNENLIIIANEHLADLYTQEFWKIWNRSKK